MQTSIELEPDIKKLHKKVMQAVRGHPLAISITDQNNKQEAVTSLIRRLLLLKLEQGAEETGEEPPKESTDKPKGSTDVE